jgi:hypothetical protein
MSLHSRYDPAREADRYVEACAVPYSPVFVVVTEPGDSYLATSLRKRYPDSRLLAIRYDQREFLDTDHLWNAVWRPGSPFSLSAFLFNAIADEYLPLTLFLPWKPADARWPEMAQKAWACIASMMRLQTDVMRTRNHFGKRWLMNMTMNAIGIAHPVRSPGTVKPVILAAAGPSLERIAGKDTSGFYVCAVSSALSALARNLVVPDLCVATDGGNWAAGLLNGISASVPIAYPLEASIPGDVRDLSPTIPLAYGGALERDFLSAVGLSGEPAYRNGTVAGTAALFMLSKTTSSVYAAGLDLCVSPSFSHARPHPALERIESSSGRLSPVAGSLFASGVSSAQSLDVYASWFGDRSPSFNNRFFRLAPVHREIPGIPSITFEDARARLSTLGESLEKKPVPLTIRSLKERKAAVIGLLEAFRADVAQGAYERALANEATSEFILMVCYTDAINLLKKSRTRGDEGEFEGAKKKVFAKALDFTDSLIQRAIRYGQ